jgi:hypothetical protein
MEGQRYGQCVGLSSTNEPVSVAERDEGAEAFCFHLCFVPQPQPHTSLLSNVVTDFPP